ncbi:MAG: hypothetical protein ACYTG0_39160 [Planctomycetota bacterium]|jgi:hypothetical protein
MPQATVTIRIQAAGKDVTFGKTLSQEKTDSMIAALLRGDSEELQAEYPAQADRIIYLYEKFQREAHNNLVRSQEVRAFQPTDAWTEEP